MKNTPVVFVKVYITESSGLLSTITKHLKNEIKIRGLSVFRATSGFGDTGEHHVSFLDLSLDLPLAVEFFDCKEKVDVALGYLSTIVKPEHIVFWDAKGL